LSENVARIITFQHDLRLDCMLRADIQTACKVYKSKKIYLAC